jgi:cytochrome c553
MLGLTAAQAAPSSNVAWDGELRRLLMSGDPARGAELETIETEESNACTDCHGVGGAEPDRDKYPTLAGQTPGYTFKQLKDYQDESRKNNRMRKAVAPLSDEDLAALAIYYSQQPVPVPELDEDETYSPATVELVYKGDKTRLIQPCAACHGDDGSGAKMNVPSLLGQNVKYFVDTMKDYAKEKRRNDVYGRMRSIAAALTREEIEELAIYYARMSAK